MTTTSPTAGKADTGQGMRRNVGFSGLMFISLGSVIGSGWLLGAVYAAQSAGGGASILAWILGGAIMALLALVHSELGAAYPVAGGTARYPRIAFGGITGFTAGWVAWLQSVTLAPIEVEASLGYLNGRVPGPSMVADNGALTGFGLIIAAVLMALFTLINILGVRWLSESNRITVIWKTAIPLITIVVLIIVTFHGSNFTAKGGFAPFGAHGIFAALPLGVAFALQGFEQASQIGGEARNPQRDLPRAILGAMIIGTVVYIGLEVAFVGSLNPADLVHGWANVFSNGDQKLGPWASLATALGITWLAVVLYIDAFISPAGTGLVYVGTSSRLSYALGHSGYVPRAVTKLSKQGVPWVSILLSFVVGLICFLPFPSWHSLVGLVTDATFFMYAFAPITLTALRRRDPERKRPYRLPWPSVLSPLSFVAANEVIYWAGFDVVWKLEVGILIGYVVLFAFYARSGTKKPALDLRQLLWILPWFAVLLVISYLGQYGDSAQKVIPDWYDLLTIAVMALVVFYVAVQMALPAERVRAAAEEEEADLESGPNIVTA
jgi:amino acid transporter